MMFISYLVFSMIGAGEGAQSFSSFGKEGIGLVEVKGVIMESKKAVEELQKAEENKQVKGIILRIDSPGGAVGPTQEIYEEIIRINQIKPIYASFGSIAASGGYYIAAATEKIYSNAGTLTGSIGVIMQFLNLSKLYKFAKVSQEVIKAGHYKDVGHPYRDMTQEERDLLTDMITNVHKKFKEDILVKRKDKIKGNLEDLAQGQIFSGSAAKKNGLVDEIGSLWKAARDLHKKLGLTGKLNMISMKKKKKFSIMDILENVEESVTHIRDGVLLDDVPLLMYRR